jgi:hypothetical protein
LELAEYKDVEHTATALLSSRYTKRLSNFRDRILELVVSKQMRDTTLYGLMLFRDFVNLLRDVRLAITLLLSPENLGHHAIFHNLWVTLQGE